jgi:hypothetical protein
VLLAVALVAVAAPAADVEVGATVDRSVVSVNDPIVLTITVMGTMRQVPAPKLPDLSEHFVVQNAGTSSNFSMVNGEVTSAKSWNYMLLPRAAGKFTIGAAEVEFGGSVYRTEPVTVEVVAGSAPASQGKQEERQSSGVQSGGREVFIATTVDRRRAFVDEQVTLSFKLYRRINLWEQPRYTPPELSGFWSMDLPPQQEFYENVNGVRYQVTEIRTALFPTASGKATIGPATLTYSEGGGFGFFSSPGRPRQLTTDPITIEVLPLPQAGKPDDFGGAVGSYRLSASIEPATVPALQPATLRLTVSGTGNLRKLPPPRLPDLPDFKVYDSRTSSDATHEGGVVGGSKTYEFVLVPQTAGAKTVPAIRLPYFVPGAGEYRVAQAGPLTLEVTQAVPGAEEAQPPAAGISRLATDIRYIREPRGRLAVAGGPVYARPWFVLLQLVPLVTLAGTWTGKRRRDRLAQDQGLARFVGAKSRARKGLRQARSGAADNAAACSAVARVVTDFVGDRLGVAARGMTLPDLEAALRRAGADDELVARVRALLERCDLGRFAGSAAQADDDLLDEAETCLRGVERLRARRARR